MKLGGRLSAAMEILAAMDREHRPANVVLADWGRAHRFAGSGDRSAIGTLVFDVLRRRRSLAARMGSDTPRALALAAAPDAFAVSIEDVAAAADGSKHAPAPLTAGERAALARTLGDDAAADVAADVPDWLVPSLTRAFGSRLVVEGRAMAERAPIDLRVNTLKTDRDKVLEALARHGAVPTPLSPIGVRVGVPKGADRAPHVEAEAAHGKGWFEVQDEGSQIAAAMTGVKPGMLVLDLCAGAGGKTLAMAAAMGNAGQIQAYDSEMRQLRPIFERLTRAGVSNVEVLEGGNREALVAPGPRFDVVLVDAPCTGSGTWRRRPDSKWRLRRAALAERCRDQEAVLALGASLVRPGGRLVYVTCSLLPEENGDRVEAFLGRNPGFALQPYKDVWRAHLPGEPPVSADGGEGGLLLTPASHGSDGFFIAGLQREAATN